jgi:hypothetical protein
VGFRVFFHTSREDLLKTHWASEYHFVGLRVFKNGLPRRNKWASASHLVGFRVPPNKEAREHEYRRTIGAGVETTETRKTLKRISKKLFNQVGEERAPWGT